MADNEIKIKVVVDDSQEKKYYSESESRRKKSTAQETEEEKRKTASLKSELDKKYAVLTQALARELEAEKQGNRLEIKEAIAKRKILESELRTFEASNRASLSRQLADFKAAKQMELIEARKNLSEFRNAPKTRLRGAIGSEAYVSQLISAQKTMQVGSQEFNQTGALIDRYQTSLKGANREVKSLSQQIGGELNSSLRANASNIANSIAGYVGFGIAISKVTQFIKQSVQAFAEDELALTKLQLGLKRLGQENSLDTLIKQQTLLQATTFFSDAQIANAQAMLTSFKLSGKEIEILTPRLLDMATQLEQTGQGTADLQQLAIQLGKATGGELVGGLKRYGVIMTDAQEKQLELARGMERTELVAKILDENFSGLSQNMQHTTAFSINYMTKALEELKEGFGGGLVSNIDNTSKSSEELAADLELVKTTGTTLAKLMSGRWVLDFEKWQKSLQTGIGDTLLSWVGLKNTMEVPITPSVSLELVDNAINTIRNKYSQWLGDRHFAKEPEAMSGTKDNSTKSGSKGSRTETQKEILNLIELEQQKLAKLNTQLNANLGDIGSELQLRREILAVELEIFRLRTGQRIDLGNALNGLNSMALTNAEPLRRIIGINSRAGNDPRGDMTSDEIQAMELSFEDMKGITDGILGGFQQMLQLTGLMETDFGKMIQWLQSVINTGSSFFDIFSTIAGFIPGGSIVSGAIGAIGGGGINPMAGGMPRSGGMSFNPTVIVNSEVEKTKSIKFYQNTMPEFNRRQALKSL